MNILEENPIFHITSPLVFPVEAINHGNAVSRSLECCEIFLNSVVICYSMSKFYIECSVSDFLCYF